MRVSELTSTPPKRSKVYVLGKVDSCAVFLSSVTKDMASIDSKDDSSCINQNIIM